MRGRDEYVRGTACPRGHGMMVTLRETCGDGDDDCFCDELLQCDECGWKRALTCAAHGAASLGWDVDDQYDIDEAIPEPAEALRRKAKQQQMREGK